MVAQFELPHRIKRVEHVSSRQNAVVKRFRDLHHHSRVHNDLLLDGPHLLQEALTSGVAVEVAVFSEEAERGRLGPLARRCSTSGARVITVPERLLAAVSPVRHASGVVAIARFRRADVNAVLARAPQLVLILDGVQDPGNVGAIIRAAEACGATGVIVGPGTAEPFGWKALRGSMGSVFRLPLAVVDSLPDAVMAARRAGLRIFAMVPRGGTPIGRAALASPAAIVLGSEGQGLPEPTVAGVDEALTIGMRSPVESLNVAIAAALLLYEASRQRTDVAVR